MGRTRLLTQWSSGACGSWCSSSAQKPGNSSGASRRTAWDQVVELGEIVAGRHRGRLSPDAITIFESQGLAMQDVAVGARLLELAQTRSVGREIEFGI